MQDLAKRKAGTPLSDAELEQRRNAARARWAALGVGSAAAIGAGVLLDRRDLKRQRQAHAERVAAAPAEARAVIRRKLRERLEARSAPTPMYPEGRLDLELREEKIRQRWVDRRKEVIQGALRRRKADARTFLRRVSEEGINLQHATANLDVENRAWRFQGRQIVAMPPGPERDAAMAAHLKTKPRPPAMSGVARQVRHLTRQIGDTPARIASIDEKLALDPFDHPQAPSGAEERQLRVTRQQLADRIEASRAERDRLLGAKPRRGGYRSGTVVTRREANWETTRRPDLGDEQRQHQHEAAQTRKDYDALKPKIDELSALKNTLKARHLAGEISDEKYAEGLRYANSDPVWAKKKEIEGRPSFFTAFRRRGKKLRLRASGTVGETWVRRGGAARVRATLSRDDLDDVAREVRDRATQVAARATLHAEKMGVRRMGDGKTLLTRYARSITPKILRHFAVPAFAYRRNWRLLGGGAAAAAIGGGLLGWVGARSSSPRPVEKLAKAAHPKSTLPESTSGGAPTEHPLAVADAAEAALAGRLAALFGRWTDAAEERLLAPSATTLHADMVAGLDRAMKPLDQVVRAGATQSIPLDDGGDSLAFTLLARSPAVRAYVDQYRQSRVVALADEQRETIKQQLIQAATEGASPQTMASRVKSVIGLTPNQASHVMNYLHELETLNPAALQRQLRDRRFDSPIRAAMEDGTVLSADFIQKAVNAYHRRYLAYRATTIARTEGVGAANNGQAAAAAALEQSHLDWEIEKEWIATQDELTRHDHHELHGQVVRGLDTPFRCDSGDEIRWPHDPAAPARQVINCRCSWITRLVPRVAQAEEQEENSDG